MPWSRAPAPERGPTEVYGRHCCRQPLPRPRPPRPRVCEGPLICHNTPCRSLSGRAVEMGRVVTCLSRHPQKTKFTFLRCAILLNWEFRKPLFSKLAWGRGLGAESDIFMCMVGGRRPPRGGAGSLSNGVRTSPVGHVGDYPCRTPGPGSPAWQLGLSWEVGCSLVSQCRHGEGPSVPGTPGAGPRPRRCSRACTPAEETWVKVE